MNRSLFRPIHSLSGNIQHEMPNVIDLVRRFAALSAEPPLQRWAKHTVVVGACHKQLHLHKRIAEVIDTDSRRRK